MTQVMQSGFFICIIATFIIMPLYAWLLVKYKHRSIYDWKQKTIRMSLGVLIGAALLIAYYLIEQRGIPIKNITKIVVIFLYFLFILDIWLLVIKRWRLPPENDNKVDDVPIH